MENKGLGFLVGLVVVGTLGWALAGSVYLGCGESVRGCSVPDGGSWYFAAMMTMP
ncbi:hypothetical protein [Streptomyces sp. SS8]